MALRHRHLWLASGPSAAGRPRRDACFETLVAFRIHVIEVVVERLAAATCMEIVRYVSEKLRRAFVGALPRRSRACPPLGASVEALRQADPGSLKPWGSFATGRCSHSGTVKRVCP
jgi:hypothetical protein